MEFANQERSLFIKYELKQKYNIGNVFTAYSYSWSTNEEFTARQKQIIKT
jgi:hypothetical protein